MFHEIAEIAKEVGIALGMDVIFDKFKKEGVAVAADKIKKKLTDEHRAELLAFIRKIAAYDTLASEALLRRQRDRQQELPKPYRTTDKYPPCSEDLYVTLLAKLYMALGDSAEEEEARIEVFCWLGRMNDKDFDSTLEFLHHDVVMQYIHKIKGVANMLPEIKDFLNYLKNNQEIREADTYLGTKLSNFNDRLEKKWWIR